MLPFLKKIFAREKEAKIIEVDFYRLPAWLEEQLSTLDFDSFIQEYFQQLKRRKAELKERVQLLQQVNLSEKERREVEPRVQNIVLGHRAHYVHELEYFLENLVLPDKEKGEVIKNCRKALEFNHLLNQKLEQLAGKTAKSYQATQHLFSEQVEEVVKSLGELNSMAKNFGQSKLGQKIGELEKIQQLMTNLSREITKKKVLQEQKKEQEKDKGEKQRIGEELRRKLSERRETLEYRDYLQLKEKEQLLQKQRQALKEEIHSYFSALQKPLRKYERKAMETKLIKAYLENAPEALEKDAEKQIIPVLQELKRELEKFDLEEKPKKNYLKLIKESEEGSLSKWAEQGKRLAAEEEIIKKRINENKTARIVKEAEDELQLLQGQGKRLEEELAQLCWRGERKEQEIARIKEGLSQAIKEELERRVEIKI